MRRATIAVFLVAWCTVAGAAPPADEERLPAPDPALGQGYGYDPVYRPGKEVGLAVPRLLLLPFRVFFIAAEPGTRYGVESEQRQHLMQHIYDAFTFQDGQVGIRPELRWSLDFDASFGLQVFDDRLQGPDTSFVVIAAGGRGNAHFEIVGRPTRPSSPVQFHYGAMYDLRSDRLFAGLGNTLPVPPGQLGNSRFQENLVDVDGVVGFRLAGPLVLSVGGSFGWRRFGNGFTEGGDPPIEEVYCVRLVNGFCIPNTVDPFLVPGFNRGTQFFRASAGLMLDLRDSTVRGSSGLLLQVGGDYSHGLGTDQSSYFRLNGSATVPINLWARSHVLLLSASTMMLAPVGDRVVPFSEFPTLGGPNNLRGFRDQQFRGYTSFFVTAEYRWPVWMWMDFMAFFDYGGVFDKWYGNFSAAQMQPDVGAGIRIRTSDHFTLRAMVAYGWGDGWRVVFSTSDWP